MNNTPNKVARVIGQVVGIALVGCVAVCLCAIALALTTKFIGLLF